MAKKQLKEIKGLPDYWACNDGSVWTTKVSPRYNPDGELRLLLPRRHPSGYLYYGCFKGKGPNKQRLWRRGHRLVWETFNGKIPTNLELDHIDGNKHNNKLSNLRLVTHSENMIAAFQRKKKKSKI